MLRILKRRVTEVWDRKGRYIVGKIVIGIVHFNLIVIIIEQYIYFKN